MQYASKQYRAAHSTQCAMELILYPATDLQKTPVMTPIFDNVDISMALRMRAGAAVVKLRLLVIT